MSLIIVPGSHEEPPSTFLMRLYHEKALKHMMYNSLFGRSIILPPTVRPEIRTFDDRVFIGQMPE